jgi:hypothetical protein
MRFFRHAMLEFRRQLLLDRGKNAEHTS